MKTAEEILKEYIKIEDVKQSETIVAAMIEYAEQFKYDYSKDCKCGNERIGETWCCNQCGLPVSKSENDINKMINFANWFHEMKDAGELSRGRFTNNEIIEMFNKTVSK